MWYLKNIPKVIHFYWGNDNLSFLRYLSVYSFRRLNPDWVIKVHKPIQTGSLVPTWKTGEQGSFVNSKDNYYSKLKELNVEFEYHDMSEYGFKNSVHEVHKSDFLRWKLLSTYGGVWSDFDIVYTRPIDCLLENNKNNEDKNTILCKYNSGSHAIGFLMSSEGNVFFRHIKNISLMKFKVNDYQSIGNKLFNDYFPTEDSIKMYLPGINPLFLNQECVYNIDCNRIPDFYNKNLECPMNPGIIGFHWYAGHPLAQHFDKIFTKDNYKDQKNTISNIIHQSIINGFSLHEKNYNADIVKSNSNQKIKVIIPAYNCEKYIEKCLDSLISQNYKNWEAIVINDCSTDNTGKLMEKYKDRISIYNNSQRNRSAIKNISFGIKAISNSKDDIIINLDGDDWFAHNYVLDYIAEVYKEDIWMTYGQYEPLSLLLDSYPNLPTAYRHNCRQVPDSQTYRKSNVWYTSHLRTFKRFLFDSIKEEDFKDASGDYFKSAGDLALMFPMIEMCGNTKAKFIDKVLYIYNDLNVLNDMRMDPVEQLNIASFVRNKQEYRQLNINNSTNADGDYSINIDSDVIIYSKDRACQLDLLLRSIKLNFKNVNNVYVLYDFSGPFMDAYNKVKETNYGLNIIYKIQTRETFYDVMKETVNSINSKYILPLCDDDVFIRKTDITNIVKFLDDDVVGICFRRSLDMKNSYHTGNFVPLPNFIDYDCCVKWNWNNYDMVRWGYPYQAGGMVYESIFFKHMINNISFNLPNYLEAELVTNRFKWGRNNIIALKKSPIVNLSINRVQNNVNNRGGRDVHYDPEELNRIFLSGKVIDYSILDNLDNDCEFVEKELQFI